jgi:Arabinose-binding domain of AraC transcription regulator, N-term
VFEYAAQAMDDSAFGLHLAEEANPRDAGMLFYIASAANDVGEALELFVRYSRIVNEAMRIKLIPAPEGAVAEITFVDHSRHSAKQVIEFASAIRLELTAEHHLVRISADDHLPGCPTSSPLVDPRGRRRSGGTHWQGSG